MLIKNVGLKPHGGLRNNVQKTRCLLELEPRTFWFWP